MYTNSLQQKQTRIILPPRVGEANINLLQGMLDSDSLRMDC